ncbi:YIP1 family protein [Rhodovulum sp. YNF3179]|uniref:YIP1 family protein n=1 Tax=Rhodovulum sp. YNF3179 TaxID=3425127 RepID=UPI003D334A81
MSVARDILRTYRAPRETLRRLLSDGPSEGRALTWLMAAAVLLFAAQLPALAREAHLSGGDPPFAALASGALLGAVVIAPLMFYGLAALSHLVARIFGGQGGWLGARIALFWALLAAAPLMLLRGLVAGFIGAGPALTITGSLAGGVFLFFWLAGLFEAERRSGPAG